MSWVGQRDSGTGSVPLIRQLNARAEEWRALELERAKRRLAKGEDIQAVMEALSRGLTQKMLHGAMTELNAAAGDRTAESKRVIQRLFLHN